MGLINQRVRCPRCNGKVHTTALGMRTGRACQWCGVALTGKVRGYRAVLVNPEDDPAELERRESDAERDARNAEREERGRRQLDAARELRQEMKGASRERKRELRRERKRLAADIIRQRG